MLLVKSKDGKHVFAFVEDKSIIQYNEVFKEWAYNDNVLEVFADGAELDFIKKIFRDLPYKENFCTWLGDMARFICANLSTNLI